MIPSEVVRAESHLVSFGFSTEASYSPAVGKYRVRGEAALATSDDHRVCCEDFRQYQQRLSFTDLFLEVLQFLVAEGLAEVLEFINQPVELIGRRILNKAVFEDCSKRQNGSCPYRTSSRF